MIVIYKITDVKFCMSLRKYHDVTFAVNDAAAYTRTHVYHPIASLFWQLLYSKFHKLILK